MNSNREIVVDFSGNDEFLFADGFDGAIIGHCSNGVVYSAPTIIQILQDNDNMTITSSAMGAPGNLDFSGLIKPTYKIIDSKPYIYLKNSALLFNTIRYLKTIFYNS